MLLFMQVECYLKYKRVSIEHNLMDLSKFYFLIPFILDKSKLWNNSKEDIISMDVILE